MTKLPTAAEIANMSASEIATTYNRFAPSAGWDTVKRFSSAAAGTKRLTALLAELRAKVPAPVKAKTPAKVAKLPKAGSGEPGTLAARLRELINDKRRLDNAAIWAIVQPEFDLADNKRGYVAGQRIYMKKMASRRD